ncbi:MAG: acyl carrier protein [Gemmatales bacterium]|nr:acyl carrier protein [Gemmatales bacterium]MDW8223780.1 acyl carrier protein [Gemmatales bacterium]
MDRARLRSDLLELLHEETGQIYEGLSDTVTLREGLGLDSFDLVNLVMQIENRYHIRLKSKELHRLESIGDLLDLLERKLGSGVSAEAA